MKSAKVLFRAVALDRKILGAMPVVKALLA